MKVSTPWVQIYVSYNPSEALHILANVDPSWGCAILLDVESPIALTGMLEEVA